MTRVEVVVKDLCPETLPEIMTVRSSHDEFRGGTCPLGDSLL